MLVSMLWRLISPWLARYDLIMFDIPHLQVSHCSQALCNRLVEFRCTVGRWNDHISSRGDKTVHREIVVRSS